MPAATDLEGLEGPQHVQGVGDFPVLGALSLCSFGCTLGLLSTLPFLATPTQGVPKVLVLICARWNSSSALGVEQCGRFSPKRSKVRCTPPAWAPHEGKTALCNLEPSG